MSNVDRIEELLKYWENKCAIIKTGDGLLKERPFVLPERPFNYAHKFRRYLFDCGTDGFVNHIIDNRFIITEDGQKVASALLGPLELAPLMITAWMRSSKCAYQLPQDLRKIMEAADIAELTWGDLIWPFSSFAIKVERPEPADKTLYDTMLVYRLDPKIVPLDLKSETFVIIMLSPVLEETVSFHAECLERLRKFDSRKKNKKEEERARRINARNFLSWMDGEEKQLKDLKTSGVGYFAVSLDPSSPITTAATECCFKSNHMMADTEKWRLSCEEALKTLAGLLAFVNHVPVKRELNFKKATAPVQKGKEEERPICNETNICELGVTNFFTEKQATQMLTRIASGRLGTVKCTHVRRAHVRTLHRGTDTEKTVLVRSSVVNQNGSVAVGSLRVFG